MSGVIVAPTAKHMAFASGPSLRASLARAEASARQAESSSCQAQQLSEPVPQSYGAISVSLGLLDERALKGAREAGPSEEAWPRELHEESWSEAKRHAYEEDVLYARLANEPGFTRFNHADVFRMAAAMKTKQPEEAAAPSLASRALHADTPHSSAASWTMPSDERWEQLARTFEGSAENAVPPPLTPSPPPSAAQDAGGPRPRGPYTWPPWLPGEAEAAQEQEERMAKLHAECAPLSPRALRTSFRADVVRATFLMRQVHVTLAERARARGRSAAARARADGPAASAAATGRGGGAAARARRARRAARAATRPATRLDCRRLPPPGHRTRQALLPSTPAFTVCLAWAHEGGYFCAGAARRASPPTTPRATAHLRGALRADRAPGLGLPFRDRSVRT